MLRFLAALLLTVLLLPAATAYQPIPADLASFYDGFDADASGSLSTEEAQIFYQWVEDNIQYRYDDEDDPDGLIDLDYGDIIFEQLGDGRPGTEYAQTPYETYVEGMGDCEDTAIFSAAFYVHHGIEAYIAEIDTDVSDSADADHATCIALLPDTEDLDFDHFELGGDRFIIIDNAYSDQFGCIDAEDTFQLVDIHTVEAELRLNSVREDFEYEDVNCIWGFAVLVVLVVAHFFFRRRRSKQ